MAFVVIYDACVLHPAPLRDLLLRVARTGIVRARWSERILDECFRSILARRPDLEPSALERTRALMNTAVLDPVITEHEGLVDGIDLPDPNDRHVVAAAIRAGAQAIVTFNLGDFPADAIGKYNLEAKHPDDFLLESIDLAPTVVVNCVREQVAELRNPPIEFPAVLDLLIRQGLPQTVTRLRELLPP